MEANTTSSLAFGLRASTPKEIAMSTTTETAATEAPKNLRQSRKETAAAKKAPAKAPAKAAPTVAEKKDKADGTLFVYEATGRAGITNRRTFPTQMAVAADVKDENHTSPRWKQGVITRFFATSEMAERYAERLRADGCDVQIVDAKLVETKEGK
jgi:Rieske Fe-S protein